MFLQIKGTALTVTDNMTARVQDVWFDLDTGRISHAVVDLGGWLTSDLALITPGRINAAGDTWTLSMTKGELTRAPRWNAPGDAPLIDWPPIVVGPFGNTLSLPLLAAQMRDARGDMDDIAQVISQTTDAASALIAAPVGGEADAITDLAIDLDSTTVTHVIIGSDHLPISLLRRAPDGALRLSDTVG
ncbi:MAG: PRC-barrel domain-containing protein [Pseudomonadota bacterium]